MGFSQSPFVHGRAAPGGLAQSINVIRGCRPPAAPDSERRGLLKARALKNQKVAVPKVFWRVWKKTKKKKISQNTLRTFPTFPDVPFLRTI